MCVCTRRRASAPTTTTLSAQDTNHNTMRSTCCCCCCCWEGGREAGDSGCRALLAKWMDGRGATLRGGAQRRRGGVSVIGGDVRCLPAGNFVPPLASLPGSIHVTKGGACCPVMAAVSGKQDEVRQLGVRPGPVRMDGQTHRVTRPRTSTYVCPFTLSGWYFSYA